MLTLRMVVQPMVVVIVGLFLIVSQPVNAASSSCSATSDDEEETCSITCPEGKAAVCTKDAVSTDCSCEE